MAGNYKVSDEQIIELIEKGLNNRQIALELGLKPAGNFNNRCREIRKGCDPGSIGKRRGRPTTKPETPTAGPVPQATESKAPDIGLRFDELRPGVKFLRNGKPIFVKAVTNKNEITIEDRFGYKGVIGRKYFDDNPGKFARAEQPEIGDIKIAGTPIKDLPDTDKEKIAKHLRPERQQAVINPEFEAAVKEMEEDLKARKQNQSVEDLFAPDAAQVHEDVKEESIPCIHFLQNCKDPRGDDFDCSECSDYIDAMEIVEASEKAEPFNLDLEMNDNTDPVEHFKDVDYTDEAWGDVEKEISDTVLSCREYLDEIDRLLDLMIPVCVRNGWSGRTVMEIARDMLESGIKFELQEAVE